MTPEPAAPEPVGSRRRPTRGDVAVAALAVLLGFVLFVPGPPQERAGTGAEVASAVLALAQGVPLAWRRSRPVPVAAAVLAAALAHAVLVGPPAPFAAWFALAGVVLHAATTRGAVTRGAAVTVATVAVLGAGPLVHGVGAGGLVATYLLTVVVVLVAALLRTERARHEALRQRAASLERERDSAQRRAAAEERLRIARDLHDLVGHGLATVAVQSSTARLVLDAGDVVAARRAVVAVEDASRAAMGEMRRLLGVLRDGTPESLAPAPGLDGLPALVDGVRGAGVAVDLVVTGDVDRVPPAAAQCVVRVVQESLTNVLRHAPGASASVRVRVGPRDVAVEVRDTGSAPARVDHARVDPAPVDPRADGAGPGFGLVGLAERVHALDGHLSAGPARDGGWRVAAALPVPAATPGAPLPEPRPAGLPAS